MMVEQGHADGFVSGVSKTYAETIRPALQVAGVGPDVTKATGCYMVIKDQRLTFFADATVNIDPDAETVAEIAIATAELASAFDQTPRIALLSFSSFGTTEHPQCQKMAEAAELVRSRRPDLIVDGEMQVDPALDHDLLERLYPFSTLDGPANVLVFPDLASGNIAYKLMNHLGGAQIVGPILLGMGKPINVLQRASDVRSIVNMVALTTLRAQGAF